jgi:Ricin-type beta-trefoil lectin domain-like
MQHRTSIRAVDREEGGCYASSRNPTPLANDNASGGRSCDGRQLQVAIVTVVALLLMSASAAAQQSLKWKRDHIYTPNGALIATATTGSDPLTVNEGSTYKLIARHSGKVLDVDASVDPTADGAIVQQWDSLGTANQKWRFQATGDGYYKIVSEISNKCLDVEGGESATQDGAKLRQWTCNSTNSQKWALYPVDQNYVKIIAKHSGKAIDVEGAGTSNGVRVQQFIYGGGANQQWLLERIDPSLLDHMAPGEFLLPGQFRQSADGRFRLIYQGDGNLVLYQGSSPLWASWTFSTNPGMAVMQVDGNFVVYDSTGPVFSAGTDGHPGAYLAVQSDGNTVIYSPFTSALWATNTCCH